MKQIVKAIRSGLVGGPASALQAASPDPGTSNRSSSLRNYFGTAFPAFGWISRKLGRFQTRQGKTLTVAALFFIVGSIHLDSPVYLLCGACLTLLLVAFVAVNFFKPALKYSVDLPRTVTAGQPFQAQVGAENIGSWTALDLMFRFHDTELVCSPLDSRSCDDFPGMISEIPPRQLGFASIPARIDQRGVYEGIRLQMRTAFPFELFHCTETFVADSSLYVVPDFKPLRSFAAVTEYLATAHGELVCAGARSEDEFVGSREYVPGTPVRRWDYRAWARIGKPHLRQYDSQADKRCSMLIDNSVSSETDEPFEGMIRLAAAVSHAVSRSATSFDWIAVGNEWFNLGRINPTRQPNEILRLLAGAKPEQDRLTIPADLEPRQTFLFLSTEFGEPQQAIVRQLRSAGHSVFPIVVIVEATPELEGRGITSVTVADVNHGLVKL